MIEYEYDIREANMYKDELDKRFAFVSAFSGMKKFPKGIYRLGQMTAREYADTIKVYRTFWHYCWIFAVVPDIYNLFFVSDIFAMCTGIFLNSGYIANNISN